VKIPTDGPPPAKVGTPVVGAVTETTAALSWPEPPDAADLRSYQVVHVTGDNRIVVATFDAADGPAGVVTGLRKNTGYNLVVRSQDVRGNFSPDSEPVKVVTRGGPDTEKPTAPTNLVATQTSPYIALSWDASTDNVGVVSYTVLRQFEDMITVYTTTTNSITIANGLGAGQSYTFLVAAKDAAGNSSPGTKLTVTMPPSQACKVSYRIVSQWDTGFVGEITISNNRATPVNGWQLGWTYTAGQRITSVWNAQLASSPGPDVFVRQASWAPGIPANGSTTFGFAGTSTGTNPAPTAVALNGVTCATG
jgi:endoglucanase